MEEAEAKPRCQWDRKYGPGRLSLPLLSLPFFLHPLAFIGRWQEADMPETDRWVYERGWGAFIGQIGSLDFGDWLMR